jgi:hypothetical protein
VEPLGHGAIRFRHLGNLRQHVTFPVRILRAAALGALPPSVPGALLHRGAFLVRESRDRPQGLLLVDADQVARGIAEGAVANPYGCSVGSWTTSAPLACSRSKAPSRSAVARDHAA